MTEILRYTAFTTDPAGGNPAGIVLNAEGLSDERMQRIAADVGFAETAFLTSGPDSARRAVRYFSPHAEVPFCGHATVAAAIAIAERGGPDRIEFVTPIGPVTITTQATSDGLRASFTSVEPRVAPLADAALAAILDLLGLDAAQLDPALPPRLAFAGNWHPVIAIADAATFDGFGFDPAQARAVMDREGWQATITVLHRLAPDLFEARNIFPVGAVTEDPATGSAAAAVGGYLRVLEAARGRIRIEQGRHVGRAGLLEIDIPADGGIVVSGHAVPVPDLRLVAADMDGTLLDGHGAVPDAFWPLLERLTAAGIAFVPASGRQYATLRRAFGAAGERMTFIAENGTFVVRAGEELSSNVIDRPVVDGIVDALREFHADGHDLGVVVCGKRSAYIERKDAAFVAETEKYYARLEIVDDLKAIDDDVLKVAVYDFVDSAHSAAALAGFGRTHQVVVSGAHWVDVMNAGVDKGWALRRLQERLGIGAAQTAAFGDYLNDLELLDAAGLSYAMANAHPEVHARARFQAPANTDGGVLTVLEALIGPAEETGPIRASR